jgi:hypothetical protein
MNNPNSYVALALHDGVVHLCVDSSESSRPTAKSLCRDVSLVPPRVAVEPYDLGNIQNFIICKGCAVRFNLMGYRQHYSPVIPNETALAGQLALF